MKLLVGKVSVLVVLVVAGSLTLDNYYRNKYGIDYPVAENVLASPEIDDKYEIVKLGSSHAQSGITFDRYNARALDLSGAGQELRYDLAFLKQYSKQIADGAVILITVTPISFSQRRSTREDGLQAIYYGRISPLFIPYLELGDYLQTQFVPFLRAGYLLREENSRLIEERLSEEKAGSYRDEAEREAARAAVGERPRLIADVLLGKGEEFESESAKAPPRANWYFSVTKIEAEMATSSAGPVDKLDESMHLMFAKWYNKEDFSPESFEQNRQDLERIIDYSLKHDWQPVVITIPISEVLEDGLADDYKQVYIYDNIAKADLQGVEYWDYSADGEFPKDKTKLFGNSDHLNEYGAAMFSYFLLRRLVDGGYLPEWVDGYDYSGVME